MIKIVTDEDIVEMSKFLTPDFQYGPCSNCYDIKRAIKAGDIKQFCKITHYSLQESKAAMLNCKQCMWFWVDEVEELEDNPPRTLGEPGNES